MKRVIKTIFSLFIFLMLSIIVKADDGYTWACEYKYQSNGVDIRIKYQITNIPHGVLISEDTLNSTGKSYVGVYYYSASESKFKKITSGKTKDYPGYSSSLGKLNPFGASSAVSNNFAKNSYSNHKVTCPALYLNQDGGLSVTSSQTSMKLTASSPVCQKNGGKTDCTNIAVDSGQRLDCEYKTESAISGKTTFRLTYTPAGGLQFNGFGKLEVEWQDKSNLENIFKNARQCPARVSCNISSLFNWGAKIKVGSSSGYTGGNSGCGELATNNGEKIDDVGNYTLDLLLNGSVIDISDEKLTCDQLLKKNLVNVLHLFITALRIGGAIIAIVSGMLALVPAVASDNADALKKAGKKCVYLAIILVAIGIFPTIINVIGKIAGFDLSCL